MSLGQGCLVARKDGTLRVAVTGGGSSPRRLERLRQFARLAAAGAKRSVVCLKLDISTTTYKAYRRELGIPPRSAHRPPASG